MSNGKNLSQNEVAGFLLGLGIGLVVGLLFQPRANDSPGGVRAGAAPKPSEWRAMKTPVAV